MLRAPCVGKAELTPVSAPVNPLSVGAEVILERSDDNPNGSLVWVPWRTVERPTMIASLELESAEPEWLVRWVVGVGDTSVSGARPVDPSRDDRRSGFLWCPVPRGEGAAELGGGSTGGTTLEW